MPLFLLGMFIFIVLVQIKVIVCAASGGLLFAPDKKHPTRKAHAHQGGKRNPCGGLAGRILRILRRLRREGRYG